MDLEQFDNIIKSSKNILIMSHINPDGDTLGSMCGLYTLIYDNYKKKSNMLLMSKIPETYNFLPYISQAKLLNEYDLSREYDVVINVDVASYDRMFESVQLFNRAKYTINIDHHITNDNYANLNLVDINASSTGEIMFYVSNKLGLKISKSAAECLYTAILTDTGSFRFKNTTSNTFIAVSHLVKNGANPADIYKKCYESNTKSHVLFQAHCINNSVFLEDDKIAYSVIYKKDIEKYNMPEDCTEGLPEKLRGIKSVEVAFIVRELNTSLVKVSMRSEALDVSEICSKFGGGGHKLAAGCVIKSSPAKAVNKIIQEIKNILI